MTGRTEDARDDLPEGSFMEFLRDTDPNLFAWEMRTESTEDLRLAIALGELCAAHKLLELDHESPGLTLREAVARWLVRYRALGRRRDSFRFVRALARERATNTEAEGPGNEEAR